MTMNPTSDGTLQFDLASPGIARVLTNRPEAMPPWQQVLLRNAGPHTVSGIELAGSGGMDLLHLDVTRSGASDRFKAFALIPGESLSLFADKNGPQGEPRLLGNFYWENPKDIALAKSCMIRRVNAEPQADGALLLAGAEHNVTADWRFNSPYPLTSGRVTWTQYPEHPLPRIWISLDGKAWARLDAGSTRIGPARAVDFSSSVAGHDHFMLRLSLDNQAGDAEDLLLSGFIIESSFEAPASIREWRPGVNEISLRRKGAADTPLHVKFLGEQ